MPQTPDQTQTTKKPLPILARHAVSLSIVFVVGLVLSYFTAQAIYRGVQLDKLTSSDQATFEQGLAYVVKHAGNSPSITDESLDQVVDLPDSQRAADLLLAVLQSYAEGEEDNFPPRALEAIPPLMQRLEPKQALGLYDGLIKIKGLDKTNAAKALLAELQPDSDAELLQVVDLLDTRLIWSSDLVQLDLWLRWLGVLSTSDDKLTQHTTVKRLGELPDAVDDPRIAELLNELVFSPHDYVRDAILNASAAYAAIAKDPTDYEQLIFVLGNDENQTIARRAWMIVGHLKPLSGFAVNWKDADPFVAEAMLWAAVKTNSQNTKAAWEAYENLNTQPLSFQSLALVDSQDKDEKYKATLYSDKLADRPDLCWRHFMTMSKGPLLEDLDPNIATIQRLTNEYRDVGVAPNSEKWNWEEHAGPILASVFCGYAPPPYEGENGLIRAACNLARGEGETSRSLLASVSIGFDADTPVLVHLIVAASGGTARISFDDLSGQISTNEELFSLGATMLLQDDTTIYNRGGWEERFQDVAAPGVRMIQALYAGLANTYPRVVSGFSAEVLKEHPDLDRDDLFLRDEGELNELGLSLVDGVKALLEAAEDAPKSAGRQNEAKLLRLALWMRGDLGDDFTPAAEAMLFDDELPTSTVLMCLLHKQRPIALDYLFGDLVTPQPDLHKLFIQQRYWHVFRRFVDTSDLTLWLWGDPDAQAFQLEAMRQWYAVNRLKIEQGWWPEPK